MTKPISNLDILSDKWFNLINKVNQISYIISTEAITANTSGADTGSSVNPVHARVFGSFTTNTVYTNSLGGGSANLASNLNITTNAVFAANSSVYLFSPSNNAITYSGNAITIVYGTDTTVYRGSGITSSNTFTVNASAVVRDLTVSNTFSINGNTSALGNTYNTIVSSNTNLGSNSAAKMIYSFDKATYSAGKLLVKANVGANTQISEILLTHNTTDVQITVYGSVASPPGANNEQNPLGNYTANVNNANVEVYLNQTISNTAVKVVANLIKG